MSKVSAIQLNSGPNVKVNLYDVKTFIEQIADLGSKMVVLPENFALMPENDADYIKHAEDLGDGQIQNYLSDLASSYKIWIVGGTIPIKSKDKDRVMASTITYNEKGEQVSLYNKIHLFDVELDNGERHSESAHYEAGQEAVIADLSFGKLGMTVCYDVRFPALFRSLAMHGADFISVPAAFTKMTGEAHWHVLLRARAIETGCFIFAPAQSGTHENGRKTYGHSIIVSPWGRVLADAGLETQIIYADIDTDQVQMARRQIPALEHGRHFEPPV